MGKGLDSSQLNQVQVLCPTCGAAGHVRGGCGKGTWVPALPFCQFLLQGGCRDGN